MSGLVLSLKADEKFLVNGALIQNGPKRSQIRLPDNSVNVLRLSDALHPDEINTPVRRAYYFAQLILSGDLPPEDGRQNLIGCLADLANVFANTSLADEFDNIINTAKAGRFYSVLNMLKKILPIEAELLSKTSQTIKDNARKAG